MRSVQIAKAVHTVLGACAMSIRELSVRIGASYMATQRIVRAYHQRGIAHIERWNNSIVPCYRFGKGADAPPPAKLTNVQKQARFRNRRKLFNEGWGE